MGIRMSGLISGLDTEAIVGALMSAQSLKKTKVVQAKTKLEWKQTKWADMNSKLTGLYNSYVTKMQLESSYKTKKATVSDETKAKVSAQTSATNGSYTMEISHIATSQYLTGAQLSADSASAKLVEDLGMTANSEITITDAKGNKNYFTVTADSTLSDFTSALKDAGLNANYDTVQKRMFISSKDSGLSNAFSITSSAVTSVESDARQAVRDAVGYDSMSKDDKKTVDAALTTLRSVEADSTEYNDALEQLANVSYNSKKTANEQAATTYMKAKLYGENYAAMEEQAKDELKSEYFDEDENGTLTLKEGKTQEDYDKALADKTNSLTESKVSSLLSEDEDVKLQLDEAKQSGKTQTDIEALDAKALAKYYPESTEGFSGMSGVTLESIQSDIADAVHDYASIDDSDRSSALGTSALSKLGLGDVVVDAEGKATINGAANDENNEAVKNGMALIAASDSKIKLNGAVLTSESTTVQANGISIDLAGTTKEGEVVTFSVSNDVDAVFDSVKKFLSEYNSVMKEMKTAYNAESAKDYSPLTSEQKKEMSDDEVEEWEKKIKDSLLRSDSTLNSIIQGMRGAMMSTVEVDGKSYSLSSFGIMTSTDYTEGGLLHIYGDPDDSIYSGQADKLKKALSEDPEAVTKALSGIFTNLRNVMNRQMASSKTSSVLTFYNDIQMKDDLKSYKKEITDWESKLASMEDAYYSKFTAMEKAMAKLQAQQSSLGNILGS